VSFAILSGHAQAAKLRARGADKDTTSPDCNAINCFKWRQTTSRRKLVFSVRIPCREHRKTVQARRSPWRTDFPGKTRRLPEKIQAMCSDQGLFRKCVFPVV